MSLVSLTQPHQDLVQVLSCVSVLVFSLNRTVITSWVAFTRISRRRHVLGVSLF